MGAMAYRGLKFGVLVFLALALVAVLLASRGGGGGGGGLWSLFLLTMVVVFAGLGAVFWFAVG